MRAEPAAHPADETLAAFGLGKADAPTVARVTRHLEDCPDCRGRVAGLSADSFLGRLRAANGGTDVPAGKVPFGAGRPAPAAVPPELAGHPDYADVRELGRGGMGVVYLAKNTLMDRAEVLKVLGREFLDRPGARDRFLREIQAAARLDHPNVVRAFTALRPGGLLVFAMEYVAGENLADLVAARGPLPVPAACFYASHAALGLQHAHEKGMVHRDIKPGNLMLTRAGGRPVVKVLDFGLAKATSEKGVDGGLTGDGRMMGTPDYIAPEQALDAAKADIRADVYSLGATLYYLLAGRPPFAADSLLALLQHHQSTEPARLDFLRPEVPAELAAVVAKMMAKDARKRYQTPAEAAAALAPFVKPGAAPRPAPDTSRGADPAPAAKSVAPPAPTPAPAAPVPTAAWELLEPDPKTEPASAPARKARRTARPKPAGKSGRPVWMWPAGAGAVLALLVALWAGGCSR